MAASRHFCRQCNARVYPYDQREALTAAPEGGKSGTDVYLYSYNGWARAKGEPLQAWCWSCNGWRQTYVLDSVELDFRYFHRQGVRFRLNGGEATEMLNPDSFVKALNKRLDEKREGSGLLQLPARRPRHRRETGGGRRRAAI